MNCILVIIFLKPTLSISPIMHPQLKLILSSLLIVEFIFFLANWENTFKLKFYKPYCWYPASKEAYSRLNLSFTKDIHCLNRVFRNNEWLFACTVRRHWLLIFTASLLLTEPQDLRDKIRAKIEIWIFKNETLASIFTPRVLFLSELIRICKSFHL